jgi:IclR family transcriptional regulator, pca regulon regulatory protein
VGADRKHFVQSLERGLSVIRAFDADSPELTLSDVARSTGLTRAAARRLLLTLVELGYVRADGRHFQLTPRVLDLGYSYLSSISLPEVAEPHLESLVAEVGESSSVAVLDADDIVYVARVPTARIMTVAISVGTRFPAYATSMGRVLLGGLGEAELDRYLKALKPSLLSPPTTTTKARLREQVLQAGSRGWAIVDQELEEGLRSAAAATHDRGGEVIAAVNVSVAAGRTSMTKLEGELLPALQVAAGRIEADLRSG